MCCMCYETVNAILVWLPMRFVSMMLARTRPKKIIFDFITILLALLQVYFCFPNNPNPPSSAR